MEIELPEKRYYSIGEVAEAFDVNPSLIRFWETEFSILNPKKMQRAIGNLQLKMLKIWDTFIS